MHTTAERNCATAAEESIALKGPTTAAAALSYCMIRAETGVVTSCFLPRPRRVVLPTPGLEIRFCTVTEYSTTTTKWQSIALVDFYVNKGPFYRNLPSSPVQQQQSAAAAKIMAI
jgi:hypothetical protein